MLKLNCELTGCTTSTDEFDENDSQVLVFPNPTSGNLNFRKSYDEILIYNSMGNLIERYDNDITESISLQHLHTGVYLLGLRVGESMQFERVIVY
jgi:hypothetical protein